MVSPKRPGRLVRRPREAHRCPRPSRSRAATCAREASPGPDRGRLLRALEDWWIARAFQPDRAACLAELERRLG